MQSKLFKELRDSLIGLAAFVTISFGFYYYFFSVVDYAKIL